MKKKIDDFQNRRLNFIAFGLFAFWFPGIDNALKWLNEVGYPNLGKLF